LSTANTPNPDSSTVPAASPLPVWCGALLLAAGAIGAALVPAQALVIALAAAVAGLALVGWGVSRLAGPPPAADAPQPVAAPAPRAAETAARDAQITDMRRELDRLREAEAQLTRAKQEAEAATMAKGEFLATMSHEIRTPLNGIIPLLDILLSTRLADDQREYLNTAYSSARQLLSIVDDILDYSKIEANKLELEQVGLNIKEIVDSVTRLLAKNAESKNLKFSATIDPNVRLAMRGDPVRLRQVLTNLVSNAIKFTERGSVAIEVKKRSDTRTHSELLFTVRDTGVGMTAEQQARLFQPFTQADASTTRIHGGTGLGLVICKRIVDLMGGQIGVKSEAGRGSAFWFTVPLLKAVGDMVPARTDLHGARAMLMTTDQALLRRVSGHLSAWGVSFVQAGMPADALTKLRAAAGSDSWAYDFLVLDWGVMKASALSLSRNVLRDSALGQLRIVAISGDDEVPGEFRGVSRFVVLGRQFGDVDLRGAMQRLLAADGEQAPASVDSLLPGLLDPLPVAPAPAASTGAGSSGQAVRPAPPRPVAGGDAAVGGHVLLVEDNAVNRQVAQRLLSLVGVSFDIAENGRQAVERLTEGRYDAVLMDCQMPIMDGYTATRTIRKLEADGHRQGHVPIIAMTANAMVGDREKCLASGMDDYMSKPLNRALLEQTLRKWIPEGRPPQLRRRHRCRRRSRPLRRVPPRPRRPCSRRVRQHRHARRARHPRSTRACSVTCST
jgi:signal transduction histidine kinase/CheY-like chemotaxis protein